MIAADALQERVAPEAVKQKPTAQQATEAQPQPADADTPAKPRGRGRPRKVLDQPSVEAVPDTTPAGD